jgi:hypothetical protein
MVNMQETLYKTGTPERFLSEYYEMAVLAIPGIEPRVYKFIELHGWWDEAEKMAKNNFTTICPEEGLTYEEAAEMFNKQREHRARGGFVYSFSQNPFGEGPHVIKL